MKKGMDNIIFENSWEIEEVMTVLEEWKDSHKSDSRNETIQKLINFIDVMCMEW